MECRSLTSVTLGCFVTTLGEVHFMDVHLEETSQFHRQTEESQQSHSMDVHLHQK